jgi:hypothetical protein
MKISANKMQEEITDDKKEVTLFKALCGRIKVSTFPSKNLSLF